MDEDQLRRWAEDHRPGWDWWGILGMATLVVSVGAGAVFLYWLARDLIWPMLQLGWEVLGPLLEEPPEAPLESEE